MTNCIDLRLDDVRSWIKPRARDANKGCFGRVLVVGGDHGMPGAVRIAGEAAARAGAGLVTVVTRKAHVTSTVTPCPELLCYGIETQPSVLDRLLDRATVLVLGPGLGQSAWSKRLYERVVLTDKPLLIDADGLNWLAKLGSLSTRVSPQLLTPHPGEAARLLGISVDQVQADRPKAVQALLATYGGVVVLKGDHTLVATHNQPIRRCLSGNPGMASAGMGDLLSGLIAGFLAQGLEAFQAAQAGVLFHAEAGDRLVAQQGELGLLATDLLKLLPELINNK